MKLFKNEMQKEKIYLIASAALILIGLGICLCEDGACAVSYFTYLINFFLVVYLIASIFLNNKNDKIYSYFSFSFIIAIFITCYLYTFVLIKIDPENFKPLFSCEASIERNIHNIILHLISLILLICKYFIFDKKGYFTYKHFLWGMAFPIGYWLFFMIFGSKINCPQYPFIKPDLCLFGTILELIKLLIPFTIFGFLLIVLDKTLVIKNKKE
ncbi:MAG: Pr6Pr family membrane protein [Spirochaetaceae bacterium]|nr:Pr6Pr family membrane protein [Spirochaetaceae bacterium]